MGNTSRNSDPGHADRRIIKQIHAPGIRESVIFGKLFVQKRNPACFPEDESRIRIIRRSPVFFPYAEELLLRYKEDEAVCAIGSMNVDAQKWGDGSYYFSMMNRNLCAWATWRRAWQRFDLRLFSVSRRQLSNALRWYGCGVLEREYWCDRLDEVHKDGCGGCSWDMQFFMSIWLNHGKGVIPNTNLSSNIGTVGEATHSMRAGNIIDNIPTQPILPLVHPSSSEIQREADRQFHFRYFESSKSRWGKMMTLRHVLSKRLKRLIGHQGPWLKKKK